MTGLSYTREVIRAQDLCEFFPQRPTQDTHARHPLGSSGFSPFRGVGVGAEEVGGG
jgi:hypothetical protein